MREQSHFSSEVHGLPQHLSVACQEMDLQYNSLGRMQKVKAAESPF